MIVYEKQSEKYSKYFVKGGDTRALGLELEFGFDLHSFIKKSIAKELYQKFKVEATSDSTLRNYLHKKLKEQNFDLIAGNPSVDGGATEIRLHPCSFEVIKNFQTNIQEILTWFKDHGFREHYGSGVHIYVDNSFFGERKDQQVETLKRLIWFLFKNKNYLISLSDRQWGDSWKSDFDALIDDAYDLLDEIKKEEVFTKIKNATLDAFYTGKSLCLFNIGINKHDFPATEFRWFASTFKVEKLLLFIEFLIATIIFNSKENSYSLEEFKNYVHINMEEFPNLFLYNTDYGRS